MTDLDAYAGHYAADYEARSFEKVLVSVRRQHVLRWLGHYGARRILEVGCGLEPLFVHYGGFDVWRTVEPVAEFARRATDVASRDPRVQVLEGRIEEEATGLADEHFDFIVVSSLLHEVPDPERLLTTVRSLSGSATVVHVNVPNARSFHRLLALEMGLIRDVSEASERDRVLGHQTCFDRAQFIELLETAGFRIEESGTYFIKPFAHSQMEAMLGTGAFPSSLIEGLDRMIRYLPDHGCELYGNMRKA